MTVNRPVFALLAIVAAAGAVVLLSPCRDCVFSGLDIRSGSAAAAGVSDFAPEADETAVTTYRIDPVHSSIVFRVKHLDTTYVYGRFNELTGEFILDPEHPDQSRVTVTVPATSIDTNNRNRDDHLRSADFFNVTEHPQLRFRSNSIRRTGDHTFEATGDLTVHGVTKSVTVPITHTGDHESERQGKRRGFEATFTIKRSEFDMEYGLGMIGDEVRITVSLQGVATG